MVFYKSVPVIIKVKMAHIRKIGGRSYNSFILDYGDVPGIRLNVITGKGEAVVNNRGYAYACRNRLRYRKNKKLKKNKIEVSK